MADASDSATGKSTDWLRYEWPFEIREVDLIGRTGFQVVAGEQVLHCA